MRLLKEGLNSIILFALLLTVCMTGIVQVQGKPLVVLLRHVLLATLGAPTPGLTTNGNGATLVCNQTTGECNWE